MLIDNWNDENEYWWWRQWWCLILMIILNTIDKIICIIVYKHPLTHDFNVSSVLYKGMIARGIKTIEATDKPTVRLLKAEPTIIEHN